MRAAVADRSGIHVQDLPEPVPGGGQVLVAPLAAGICGSDLHALDALAIQGEATPGEAAPSIVLGHEFCALVLDHGFGTSRRLAPGTRVVSIPYAYGPAGPELLGFSAVLSGAFAERMVVEEQWLLPVPAHVTDEQAAFTEPLAVGVHAVAEAGLAPTTSHWCLGAGPLAWR